MNDRCICIYIHIYICIYIYVCVCKNTLLYMTCNATIPVIPHKAAAEVSKIDNYRTGELLRCMDGRTNPLMDRKVVGVVFFWSGCCGHLTHIC